MKGFLVPDQVPNGIDYFLMQCQDDFEYLDKALCVVLKFLLRSSRSLVAQSILRQTGEYPVVLEVFFRSRDDFIAGMGYNVTYPEWTPSFASHYECEELHRLIAQTDFSTNAVLIVGADRWDSPGDMIFRFIHVRPDMQDRIADMAGYKNSAMKKNYGRKNCYVCGRNDVKIMRCKRCQSIYYCGQDCQHQDWPEHKKVCYKRTKSQGPPLDILFPTRTK